MNTFISRLSIIFLLLVSCQSSFIDKDITYSDSDLIFQNLPQRWDEGIPLGNSVVGALIWQDNNAMRFSLDRVDLWDLRPNDSLSGDNYNFQWLEKCLNEGMYDKVREKLDDSYDLPAPTKIPGAALEIPLKALGKIKNVRLSLHDAVCVIEWESGLKMKSFVHADKAMGMIEFSNIPDNLDASLLTPKLIAPNYDGKLKSENDNSHSGSDLKTLGYQAGTITTDGNNSHYHQNGWNNFYYDVACNWENHERRLSCSWSVTSSEVKEQDATKIAKDAIDMGFNDNFKEHMKFWNQFWAQSSIVIPDTVLQRQYDREMYKLGSAARENSYPISLQAVWTADNGQLPPWKGDYHHDLNTQLSYWPVYASNHLKDGLGYINTMWNQKETYEAYTEKFWGTNGINVPGVCDLKGNAMGGWAQYSMSPTIGGWLAQHFYLHWKYSMDTTFLRDKAYPFIKGVATHLKEIGIRDSHGLYSLPLSSSPEIFDNTEKAWFKTITNYDLSIVHFTFSAAKELAAALNLNKEAGEWNDLLQLLPDYVTDEKGCLEFAIDCPYETSHRHFSHMMSIHPFGMIDWSQGERSQDIIIQSIKRLDDVGPDYWTGYSYAWLGNLKARMMDGDGASKALKTFATCFCSKNSFHLNGDQSKTGKSQFTYRPFTLEGNFAFASGILEMLIQSHTGVIHIFPAIPSTWKNVSFTNLRAQGAFLVSASMCDGHVQHVTIKSEKGGTVKIILPTANQALTYEMKAGQIITVM